MADKASSAEIVDLLRRALSGELVRILYMGEGYRLTTFGEDLTAAIAALEPPVSSATIAARVSELDALGGERRAQERMIPGGPIL